MLPRFISELSAFFHLPMESACGGNQTHRLDLKLVLIMSH